MINGISNLDFDDITELAPAFITMVAMPLTYSISEGIALGFITYVGVKLLTGKHKDISLLTGILSLVFLAHYIL